MSALIAPRILSLFRNRTPEEQRFYEIAPAQRATMAVMYFGLIAALVFAMHEADLQLHHVRERGHAGRCRGLIPALGLARTPQ